ncbi:hypothetical protein KAK05_03890 [Candidatus Parcubacteria bacterium]|nr:hypothetical protein [Candidatus Parcubacteria bacterium]
MAQKSLVVTSIIIIILTSAIIYFIAIKNNIPLTINQPIEQSKTIQDPIDNTNSMKKNAREKKYKVDIEKKRDPSWYKINENGTRLIVMDDLVFINLETGEEKRFNIFKDLAHSEIDSYLKEIPVPTQYYLYVNTIGWSEDKSILLGSVDLFPSADPPMVVESSFFKIITGTWNVEKFQDLP